EWLWNLNRPAYEQFETIGRPAGLFLYAVAIAATASGLGLLRRRKWAWWIAVLTFAVNCCGDLVSLFILGDWIKGFGGVAVSGTFIYLLTRRSVRDYLEPASSKPSPAHHPLESKRP